MCDKVSDFLNRLAAITPIACVQKQVGKIIRPHIATEHSLDPRTRF
jgi:hypothetical protein